MTYFRSDRRRASLPNTGEGSGKGAPSPGDYDLRVWTEARAAMVEWHRLHDDADPPDLPEDATWSVERSSSPYGPWSAVAEGLPRSTRRVRDDAVNQDRTQSRYVFYRVRWDAEGASQIYGKAPQWDSDIPDPGGVTWNFGGTPAHLAPAVNREIRARSAMIMHSFQGEPCLIYRPSWMNPTDAAVVDPVTGILKGSWGAAASSLGQPFLGGYDHPVAAMLAGHRGAPVTVQAAGGRISDMPDGIQGEMLYWPPVQIDDILRMLNGDLLYVTQVSGALHAGHLNTQLVGLSLLPSEHPVTLLPMPEGFRERALYPRRMASRSMNMEAYQRSRSFGAQTRASHRAMAVDPAASGLPGGEDR